MVQRPKQEYPFRQAGQNEQHPVPLPQLQPLNIRRSDQEGQPVERFPPCQRDQTGIKIVLFGLLWFDTPPAAGRCRCKG